MENYTRIPDSIRKSKTLTLTEKFILGYLFTYQIKVVGDSLSPTTTYCYLTQENLAEELGISLITVKRSLITLKDKGLIFTTKKGLIDGKPQYKNRLAIIMVDEFNQLPTKEVFEIESNEIIEPIIKENIIAPVVIKLTSTKKINNKKLLSDIVMSHLENGDINTGQSVDIINKIENNKIYYIDDLKDIINEDIEYNKMCKQL